MSAMRALIVVSRSLEILSPCITSSTSVEICRRDSSRCSSLRDRVWPMTWSNRLASWPAASADWDLAPFGSLAISPILLAAVGRSDLAADLLQHVGVADDLLQLLGQLVIAVHLGQQRLQLQTCLPQRAEGLDLPDGLLRFEVLERVELQLDRHLGIVVAELVVDPEREPGLHAPHHRVEVVAIDLHELAVPQARQRLLGLPGQVGEHAEDEG